MQLERIIVVAALALLSAFFQIVPGLTRVDLFFSVTVEAEFRRTAEARRILRNFRVMVWVATLAAMALELTTGLVLVALAIQAAGYLAGLVAGHHRALAFAAHPESPVEVDLRAPVEKLPGGVLAAALPILFLGALGVWTAMNWERLPQRVPVHWGLQAPDGWVTTTPAAVAGVFGLLASLCLFMAGAAWGLLHWSRRISTSGARAASERRFRGRIVRLLIVVEYFVVAPACFTVWQVPIAVVNAWALALTATILGFAISLIRAGQGGDKEAAVSHAPTGDRTPDSCWKWGVFYYNPADPAVFIEKRFGVGYTVNFGNGWSWTVLGLILIPVAVALIALR